MRAVVQRVTGARVLVDAQAVGAVGRGLLVYLGVGAQDGPAEAAWMGQKIAGLRIFPDVSGRMTLAPTDIAAEVLVVSQFTLYGDVRKGRRPSFDRAAPPDRAQARYEECCTTLRELGLGVSTGRFRTHMDIQATIDGPVTILIDSEKGF